MSTADFADRFNALPGWDREMGLTITRATADEVTAEWEVEDRHHQGYGILHGGVHCAVVESLASIGAAVAAEPWSRVVVGLENSTSFLRAVRSGRLKARATPVTRGRTTQVWEVRIEDAEARLVATGRVRLICLDPDRPLAGSPAAPAEA